MTDKSPSVNSAGALATATVPAPPASGVAALMASPSMSPLAPVLKEYRTSVAAGVSGFFGVLVGYPFDNMKTRMQTHYYASMSDCIRKTAKSEGIGGFYRGVVPPLFTVSLLKSLTFSIYERSKKFLVRVRAPIIACPLLFAILHHRPGRMRSSTLIRHQTYHTQRTWVPA